jgi:hypothetical protein
MSSLNLAKLLSAEYIIGLLIGIAIAYAGFTAWQSDANARTEFLEERAAIWAQDHDAIIRLQADVAAIKESVKRIEQHILFKKEAINGVQ